MTAPKGCSTVERVRGVRSVFAVAVVALAGCGADVVLGRYFPLDSSMDGGVDAGGVGVDGGPAPNLVVRFLGEFVTDVDAGSFPLEFQVQNLGDAGVADLTLNVLAPAEVEFLAFPGCTVSDGAASCSGAGLPAFATRSFSASVRFPTTPRWLDVDVIVSTTTPESRLDDNTLRQPLALTPAGGQPLLVTAPRYLDLIYCVGTNLMTFSRCVSGSRIYETIALSPDGRLGVARDGGEILPDGGFVNIDLTQGFWLQGSDTQNFAFRFVRPDGGYGSGYLGGSVNATCFEGTANNGAQVPHGIAWQGCLR